MAVGRSTLWAGAAIATGVVAVAYRLLGLVVAVPACLPHALMLALMIAVAVGRSRLETAAQHRLADLIELVGLFCWITLVGGLASYAVAAASTGYSDGQMARADAVIGFDWLGTYRYLSVQPWWAVPAGLAYRSIFATPLVVIVALVWTGRAARAVRFIALFAIALLFALAAFYVWPAQSALAHYVGTDPAYLPATGLEHVALIDGLRRGTVTIVDPRHIVGMITFPSFHAVCAVLFTWAGWPVRRLRPPLIAVNAAMLVVTPVEGTHYLVDVIAGILLASAVITFGLATERRRARAQGSVRSPATA